MLDKPSAGLSLAMVDRVLATASKLRETGTSVILVEQLIEKAISISDRVYALVGGALVLEARGDEPGLAQRLEKAYFPHGWWIVVCKRFPKSGPDTVTHLIAATTNQASRTAVTIIQLSLAELAGGVCCKNITWASILTQK
jgi:energy-coupling factor transporter ATP-binding protein EcfA2